MTHPAFSRPVPLPPSGNPAPPPTDIILVNSIPTIAALRTFTGQSQNMAIMVEGSAAAGDGGAGSYFWNSTDVTPDNGTTVIQPTGIATGRWNQFISNTGSGGGGSFNPVTDPFILVLT